MPATPYSKLRASVNAGAPQTGGLTLVADDVVQLSPESTAGWNVATTQYQITAFPPGWPGPAGWSFNSAQGFFYYNANGVNGTSPPPITMPSSAEIAAGLWGKWKFRLLVNGGGGQLTDDTLAIRVLSQSGLDDVARREAGEFDAILRWVAVLQQNFRIVDAAIAGGLGGGVSLGAGTPAVVHAGAGTQGALSTAAPFDHRHQVSTGTPTGIGAANAAGSATSLARSDHVHDHGAQTDPLHHALASGSAHGFFSSTLWTKLAGIEAGAQVTSFARVQTALGLASSDIAVNSVKITGLANGTNQQDAVTVAQLQAASFGFDLKQEVRGASTANVTLVGALTMDGITYDDDDRFLAKNQTAPEENGIWIVDTGGAWTRAADADSSTEVTAGMLVFVLEGTVNGKTGWALFDPGPFVIGTDALNFTQVFGPGAVVAGNGLTQSGNQIDVVAGDPSIVVGPNSITVGVISDAQHGNRGNGSLHTVADVSHDGFMPQAHWSLVNGATASPTANTLAKRGASGEAIAAWFASASSGVATAGLVRSAATATLLAAAGAVSGNNLLVTVASDVLNLGDPAKTAGVSLKAIPGGSVDVNINSANVLLAASWGVGFGATYDNGHGVGVYAFSKATTAPDHAFSNGFILYDDPTTEDVMICQPGLHYWTVVPKTGGGTTPTTANMLKAQVVEGTSNATTTTIWSYTPGASESVRIRLYVEGRESDLWISQIRELRINMAAGAPTLTETAIGTDLNTIGGGSGVAYDVSAGTIRVRATGVAATNITWKVTAAEIEVFQP